MWPAKPTILLILFAFLMKTSFVYVKTCNIWPLNIEKKCLARHGIRVVHHLRITQKRKINLLYLIRRDRDLQSVTKYRRFIDIANP